MNSFFDGRVASPCLKPCLETKVTKFKDKNFPTK